MVHDWQNSRQVLIGEVIKVWIVERLDQRLA